MPNVLNENQTTKFFIDKMYNLIDKVHKIEYLKEITDIFSFDLSWSA